MNKKITKTTIKSFIRKNQESLHIKSVSRFDPIVDCVMPREKSGFSPVVKTESFLDRTWGIDGAWFVGRDSYFPYSDGSFTGFEVYNCCGSFILAIPSTQ